MQEFDPDAHLILVTTEDKEVRADRTNLSLFTHIGELAMYDHAFFLQDENWGTYIFRHSPIFDGVREFIEEHQFTQHLHLTEVADCDTKAFDQSLSSDVPDSLPDDWTN